MKLSFQYLSPHNGEEKVGVSIMPKVVGVGIMKAKSGKGHQMVASMRILKMVARGRSEIWWWRP